MPEDIVKTLMIFLAQAQAARSMNGLKANHLKHAIREIKKLREEVRILQHELNRATTH